MADAGNGEYHNAVQHQNRELRTENDGLRAEVLRLNEEREIAIENHGPNCFERKPREMVGFPISLSLCMPLSDFSLTFWTPR